MLKKVILPLLIMTGIVAVYAGSETKQEESSAPTVAKVECKTGCCTAKASPTESDAKDVLKRSPRPANAEVYIISPKDGDVVGKKFKVIFGLKGMGVAPAGINLPNTGHHHLLVNVDKLPDLSLPIPADKNHLHFGKGQTETTLELEPGEHTLQLLLGNYLHIPHDKEVISKKIKVTVK